MVTIVKVRSDTDVDDVKTLINEFINWLSECYLELEETIATYFKQQGFEEEMNNLLGVFGPPGGECLLARIDDQPVGILMMKEHGLTVCEMNRMFVCK
jgi:hypothetical protein